MSDAAPGPATPSQRPRRQKRERMWAKRLSPLQPDGVVVPALSFIAEYLDAARTDDLTRDERTLLLTTDGDRWPVRDDHLACALYADAASSIKNSKGDPYLHVFLLQQLAATLVAVGDPNTALPICDQAIVLWKEACAHQLLSEQAALLEIDLYTTRGLALYCQNTGGDPGSDFSYAFQHCIIVDPRNPRLLRMFGLMHVVAGTLPEEPPNWSNTPHISSYTMHDLSPGQVVMIGPFKVDDEDATISIPAEVIAKIGGDYVVLEGRDGSEAGSAFVWDGTHLTRAGGLDETMKIIANIAQKVLQSAQGGDQVPAGIVINALREAQEILAVQQWATAISEVIHPRTSADQYFHDVLDVVLTQVQRAIVRRTANQMDQQPLWVVLHRMDLWPPERLPGLSTPRFDPMLARKILAALCAPDQFQRWLNLRPDDTFDGSVPNTDPLCAYLLSWIDGEIAHRPYMWQVGRRADLLWFPAFIKAIRDEPLPLSTASLLAHLAAARDEAQFLHDEMLPAVQIEGTEEYWYETDRKREAWNYRALWFVGEHKVQIEIRSQNPLYHDYTVATESYARARFFNARHQWQILTEIAWPYAASHAVEGEWHRSTVKEKGIPLFYQDEATLIERVQVLLTPPKASVKP